MSLTNSKANALFSIMIFFNDEKVLSCEANIQIDKDIENTSITFFIEKFKDHRDVYKIQNILYDNTYLFVHKVTYKPFSLKIICIFDHDVRDDIDSSIIDNQNKIIHQLHEEKQLDILQNNDTNIEFIHGRLQSKNKHAILQQSHLVDSVHYNPKQQKYISNKFINNNVDKIIASKASKSDNIIQYSSNNDISISNHDTVKESTLYVSYQIKKSYSEYIYTFTFPPHMFDTEWFTIQIGTFEVIEAIQSDKKSTFKCVKLTQYTLHLSNRYAMYDDQGQQQNIEEEIKSIYDPDTIVDQNIQFQTMLLYVLSQKVSDNNIFYNNVYDYHKYSHTEYRVEMLLSERNNNLNIGNYMYCTLDISHDPFIQDCNYIYQNNDKKYVYARIEKLDKAKSAIKLVLCLIRRTVLQE